MSRAVALLVLLASAVLLPGLGGQDKKTQEAARKKMDELVEQLTPQRAKDFSNEEIAAILEKLADGDREVRHDAQLALRRKLRGRAGTAELKAVLKGTTDKRAAVRAEALAVLWLFENKVGHEAIELQIVPAVARGAKDKDATVRLGALRASSYGAHSKAVVNALIPLLDEDDWPKDRESVPAAAAEWLCRPHPNYAKARELIFAKGKDKKTDIRMRRAAISALGFLGQSDPKWLPKVVPMLTGYLKDRDEAPEARWAAVSGLNRLRGSAKEAVPAIRDVMAKPGGKDAKADRDLRRAMMGLLEAIGPGAKESVPDLVKILKDPKSDERERDDAVTALGKIGPGAKQALPYLRTLVKDRRRLPVTEAHFQRNLARALEEIQAKE